MMTHKKRIFPLTVAVAMTFATVSEANAVTFPFTGAKAAPSQDVIAANLDEITPKNTVAVVHGVPQVAPSLTASQMPNPTGAAFGVATAIKDPNMSQQVPDCPAPPPPPPNCNNVGQCGSPGGVEWSGWDHVSGGVCNGGGPGGWYVIPAGPAPANVYPPASSSTTSGSGGGQYAALDSASGISANGTTTKCNPISGACTITYDLGTGTGYRQATVNTTMSALKSGSISLPGTTATVGISGGNVVTTNTGVQVDVNAATNVQDGGASLAQQGALINKLSAASYSKESQAVQQQMAASAQQANDHLLTYGNNASSSSVSNTANAW